MMAVVNLTNGTVGDQLDQVRGVPLTRDGSVWDAYPLFQEGGGGSTPTSSLQLRIEKIKFSEARRLNALWHSRLPRMGIGCVSKMPFLSFCATYDSMVYAVAIWSNPVARMLPQDTWLELRRLAIAPDAPKNTASRMLSIMKKIITNELPIIVNLVSYQDMDVHTGGIYKAAGWVATSVNKSTKWDMSARKRPKAQSESHKQRWETPIRRLRGKR